MSVILPPEIVTLSWSGPYRVGSTALVTVLVDPEVETLAVDVVAVVAVVAAAGAWVWNPSVAPRPAAVAARTMVDRFISGSGSEREGLVVDLGGGDARLGRGDDERLLEGVGAAHVDVAPRDVGDQRGERRRVEAHAVARTDELEQPAVALEDVFGDLVAVDEVVARRAAQRDHHVGLGRQLLEQGADRRDADAGADQQHAVARPRVGGEDAVGPLDRHRRAGPEPGERRAVVAEVLDGDAQVAARRRGRQGIGVRLPPQPAAQEAPLQELAAGDRQAVEPAPAQDDAVGVRALAGDGDDVQAMAQ